MPPPRARPPPAPAPAAPATAPVALVHPLHLEPEDAVDVAEPLRGVAALLVDLERPRQVAVLDHRVAQVGIAAHALQRVVRDRQRDALLEVGDAALVADAGARDTDAVQRVRAQ